MKVEFKYPPKLATSLIFFVLYGINAILFMGRKSETIRSEILLNYFPDMYHHISNFTLSCMMISGIGYVWLMTGVKFVYISLMVIGIVAVNFIYELWVPILNTRDVVDAYYGLAGSLIGYVFLVLSQRYGFIYNTKSVE